MADRRLQVFHAVARQLSFTKAAEQLFMTQPAVTFQIKQLEEHLNARLFERNHGRITLTPAGELVLHYAGKILALTGLGRQIGNPRRRADRCHQRTFAARRQHDHCRIFPAADTG